MRHQMDGTDSGSKQDTLDDATIETQMIEDSSGLAEVPR